MSSQPDQPDAAVVLAQSRMDDIDRDPQGFCTSLRSSPGIIRRLLIFSILLEMTIVKAVVSSADRFNVKFLSSLISRLGNGWIYFLIPLLSVDDIKNKKYLVFVVSGANAAIAHSVYPLIKGFAARLRPFEVDPTLRSEHAPKDVYSFPSGHTMTLTAVLTPMIYASPELFGAGAALICAMCWARMASAHHYLTDVVSGVVLGGVVSYPLSYICLIR